MNGNKRMALVEKVYQVTTTVSVWSTKPVLEECCHAITEDAAAVCRSRVACEIPQSFTDVCDLKS